MRRAWARGPYFCSGSRDCEGATVCRQRQWKSRRKPPTRHEQVSANSWPVAAAMLQHHVSKGKFRLDGQLNAPAPCRADAKKKARSEIDLVLCF